VKGLYALAFVLSSFSAFAQTPGAPTPVLVFELDDYFGELTDLSTIPLQSIPGQSFSEKSEEATSETQSFTIRRDKNAEDEAVGAIRPSDKSAYVESPIWWGDDPATEKMMGTTTAPAPIEAPEPKMDRSAYIESPIWWGDEATEHVMDTTTPGEIEASEPKMDKSAYVKSPIWWDDKLAIEDMIDETGTAEHSTVTDKELSLDEAMDVPVAGSEPSHEPATESWSPREDKKIISEAIGHTAGLPPAL
jgi:hypothetical protein